MNATAYSARALVARTTKMVAGFFDRVSDPRWVVETALSVFLGLYVPLPAIAEKIARWRDIIKIKREKD